MVLLALLVHVASVAVVLAQSPVGCLSTPPPDSCKAVLDAVQEALDGENGERKHWVVDTNTDPFYQTPQNVSSYRAGDLIRFDKPGKDLMQKYKIPAGLTLYRIMYQSIDMDNHTVPASAFVLLPYTRPHDLRRNPLEVIAWAHGTSGIERHCAPSNQDDLYYQYEAPFAMALQGFAVIATDYAGQGTNTTFNYLAGPSHAADIANSVRAARKALAKVISDKWVVVGHSEGGLTAWATNEREVQHPTPGFLGAVSIGPALANLRIIRKNIQETGGRLGDTLLYPSYTLTTIARLNKSVNVTKYYSEVGRERAQLAAQGCFNTAVAAFKNLTFQDVFSDQSWLNSSFAEAWETRTGVHGEKKLAKPMLIVEGLNDAAVPFTVIDGAFNTQCKTHPDAKVHLSKYPNMDHDEVAYVSQLEYFDWIRDLFKGRAPKKCETATIDLVTPGSPSGNSTGAEVGRR